jgi:hypothetical protein
MRDITTNINEIQRINRGILQKLIFYYAKKSKRNG